MHYTVPAMPCSGIHLLLWGFCARKGSIRMYGFVIPRGEMEETSSKTRDHPVVVEREGGWASLDL